MRTLGKALVMGAAGVAAYKLVKRARRPDPARYFRGASAVVTGGASGIGLAVVEQLYRYGARLLVVDIDGDALRRVREAYGVDTLELDCAADGAPALMLEKAVERLGDVDVLFSNAGIVWAAPFLAMTEADIERLVTVNFTMQVKMTHAFLAYFLARGRGVIAYTGSLSSYVYSPMHSVYTGTKGGLNNFVHAVRRELPRGSKVQLTVVHPNLTKTNLVASEVFDEVRRIYWLQTPEQVAAAFLEGVAEGRREVFVEVADYGFKWAERLVPAAIDKLFDVGVSDTMKRKGEAAVAESKLRKQLAAAEGSA